ncbi:twin-arginine translocation signal domain-containing protein [Candidatus Kaiserbacteria bacterium]|nr:twin-arginine translocation signal domain-containing protein [Candidatus Kaiserbacteria bacterium]
MENLSRRNFLKNAGATLAATAVGIPSLEAHASGVIGETYSHAERDQALAAGLDLYTQLLENNPNTKEKLKDYMFSMSDVRGGSRNHIETYEAYVIHRKEVSVDEGFMTIGGATLISPGDLDKQHPGVHAVIPAEIGMKYERFLDLFNRFVKSYKAK